MNKYLFLLLFFLFLTPTNAQVLKVIDGDTINLNGEKIRFGGIDAPESYFMGKKQTCFLDKKEVFCGQISKNKLIEKIGNNSDRKSVV